MFVPLGKIKDMIQLHETIMGKRLIEGTLPDIADQLKRIADSLEKLLDKQNADPVEPTKEPNKIPSFKSEQELMQFLKSLE